MPKCAGTTLNKHFDRVLPDGAFVRPEKFRGLGKHFGRTYDVAALPPLDKARLISGHYGCRSIEDLIGERPIRRAILLRDPTSFFLSYYNYRLSRYRSKGQGAYTFRTALFSQPRNPQAHFILKRYLEIPAPKLYLMSDFGKARILSETLSGFWFVGRYLDCDRLIDAIADELGVEGGAERQNTLDQWRRRSSWRATSLEALDETDFKLINRENRLDQWLYDTWAQSGFERRRIAPFTGSAIGRTRSYLRELRRPYYQVKRRIGRLVNMSDEG